MRGRRVGRRRHERPAGEGAGGLSFAVAGALSSAILAGGCTTDIPSASYIYDTRLISVRAEVVELGPLNPDRVGPFMESPIAEAMPGDRVRLTALVVDPDGRELGPEEVESLWIQCGVSPCHLSGAQEYIDLIADSRPCEELAEWTSDSACRLGIGDTQLEFEFPPLAQEMVDVRRGHYYGVVAWDGHSASECLERALQVDEPLDGCAFIERVLKVGPSWWLLAYAEEIGLSSPIPLEQIPVGVYYQLANRSPRPNLGSPEVFEVVQTESGLRVRVHRGDRFSLVPTYEDLEQYTQSFFVASPDEEGDVTFAITPETVTERVLTTGAVHLEEVEGRYPIVGRKVFFVDEYGELGLARVFIISQDERWSETVSVLDFEVVE